MKIIMVGNSKVGKTTIAKLFAEGVFATHSVTTGCTFFHKKIQLED